MDDLKGLSRFIVRNFLGIKMYSRSRKILESVPPGVLLPLFFYFGWIVVVIGIIGWGLIAVLSLFTGVSNPISIGQRLLFAIPVTGAILAITSWLIRNAFDEIEALFEEDNQSRTGVLESFLYLTMGILIFSGGLLYRQLALRRFPTQNLIELTENQPLLSKFLYETIIAIFILIIDSLYIGILLLSFGLVLTGYYQLGNPPKEDKDSKKDYDKGDDPPEDYIEDLDHFT